MSNERNKVTDKAGEIARNIWLAGVGAYGRAVEDAQERIEKAMEPPKLFRDLVKAGAALEEEARVALQSTAAARQSVEERIQRVRENFHMQRPARIEDLAALHAKVDELARQFDALCKALKAEGVDVPASRRSAQRPASKTKRTAAAGSRATPGKATGKKATRGKAPRGKSAGSTSAPRRRSSAAGKRPR